MADSTSGAISAFLEYSQVDFFAVHLDFARRSDPDAYLTSFHGQYCNGDIITDDQSLPNPSCQNEHSNLPVATACVTKKGQPRSLPWLTIYQII